MLGVTASHAVLGHDRRGRIADAGRTASTGPVVRPQGPVLRDGAIMPLYRRDDCGNRQSLLI